MNMTEKCNTVSDHILNYLLALREATTHNQIVDIANVIIFIWRLNGSFYYQNVVEILKTFNIYYVLFRFIYISI